MPNSDADDDEHADTVEALPLARRKTVRTRTIGCSAELPAPADSLLADPVMGPAPGFEGGILARTQRRRSSVIGFETTRRCQIRGSIFDSGSGSKRQTVFSANAGRRKSLCQDRRKSLAGGLATLLETSVGFRESSRSSSSGSSSSSSSGEEGSGGRQTSKTDSVRRSTEATRIRREMSGPFKCNAARRQSVIGFEASDLHRMSISSTSSSGSSYQRRKSLAGDSLLDSRFRTARSTDMLKLLQKSHQCLHKIDIFKKCEPEFVDVIMEYVKTQIFQAGSNILTRGEPGNSMYMLVYGTVEVIFPAPLEAGDDDDDDAPRETVIATLNEGDVFGEMAVLGHGEHAQRRTATVRALSFCDCRVIERDALQCAFKGFPINRTIVAAAARRRSIELEQLGFASRGGRKSTWAKKTRSDERPAQQRLMTKQSQSLQEQSENERELQETVQADVVLPALVEQQERGSSKSSKSSKSSNSSTSQSADDSDAASEAAVCCSAQQPDSSYVASIEPSPSPEAQAANQLPALLTSIANRTPKKGGDQVVDHTSCSGTSVADHDAYQPGWRHQPNSWLPRLGNEHTDQSGTNESQAAPADNTASVSWQSATDGFNLKTVGVHSVRFSRDCEEVPTLQAKGKMEYEEMDLPQLLDNMQRDALRRKLTLPSQKPYGASAAIKVLISSNPWVNEPKRQKLRPFRDPHRYSGAARSSGQHFRYWGAQTQKAQVSEPSCFHARRRQRRLHSGQPPKTASQPVALQQPYPHSPHKAACQCLQLPRLPDTETSMHLRQTRMQRMDAFWGAIGQKARPQDRRTAQSAVSLYAVIVPQQHPSSNNFSIEAIAAAIETSAG